MTNRDGEEHLESGGIPETMRGTPNGLAFDSKSKHTNQLNYSSVTARSWTLRQSIQVMRFDSSPPHRVLFNASVAQMVEH